MASVAAYYPSCQSAQVCRHGHKPRSQEQITEIAFDGAGGHDTSRTLKVGINIVIRTLKNSH